MTSDELIYPSDKRVKARETVRKDEILVFGRVIVDGFETSVRELLERAQCNEVWDELRKFNLEMCPSQ